MRRKAKCQPFLLDVDMELRILHNYTILYDVYMILSVVKTDSIERAVCCPDR